MNLPQIVSVSRRTQQQIRKEKRKRNETLAGTQGGSRLMISKLIKYLSKSKAIYIYIVFHNEGVAGVAGISFVWCGHRRWKLINK